MMERIWSIHVSWAAAKALTCLELLKCFVTFSWIWPVRRAVVSLAWHITLLPFPLGLELMEKEEQFHYCFGDMLSLLSINGEFLYSKLMSSQVPLFHVFQQQLTLGWVILFFFAGIRNWSEIYRYVMILAHFEVGINMPICYLTMKIEVFWAPLS